MKKIVLIICMGLFLFATTVQAAPVTLINQGDTWNYVVITTYMPNFYSADYSSFNWEGATWLTGQAAFGNTYSDPYTLPYNTEWLENTYLALSKTVNVNGIFTSDLTLNVASDNGFIFFVNGMEVVRYWASGYTNYWEYTIPVNASFFSQGLNTISVLAQDQGGVTFFDMELTGDLQCVPPPASILFEDFEETSGFTIGGGGALYWGTAPLSGTASIPSNFLQGKSSQCGTIFYGSLAKQYQGSPAATMTIALPDLSGYTNLKLTVALAAPDGPRWENTHRDSLHIIGGTEASPPLVDCSSAGCLPVPGTIDSFLPTARGGPLQSQIYSIDLQYQFQDFTYEIDSSLKSLTFAFASTANYEVIGIDSVRITGDPIGFVLVPIDIKPGSCPNPLNVKSKGVLPVSVLGTEVFDVSTIDPASIRLSREGVEGEIYPLRWSYEDVATPFEGEVCGCHELYGDCYMDLSLKFDTQDVVETLKMNEVLGTTLPLTLTGNLKEEFGGTPIKGEDCVWVLQKGK